MLHRLASRLATRTSMNGLLPRQGRQLVAAQSQRNITHMDSPAVATFRRKYAASDVFSVGRLNHIAIAVPDLEKASAFYRDVLGGDVSEPQALPEHGVTVVFVNLPNTKIELLEPLGKSPIAGYLKKNPDGGMHHICLEVDDIAQANRQFKEKGLRLLNEEPKIGAHGKPVTFVHPKDCGGVLVEVEEV